MTRNSWHRRVGGLLLAAALAGCGGGEAAARAERGAGGGPPPAVEAVRAREGALPLRETLTGTVRADGQVAIYPQTSGVLTEVLAQDGDLVRAGQPLARIRAQTSRTQLAQARAGLDVAQAELRQARANVAELEAQFERTRVLAAERLVSAEALETQRAQLEAARASAARAEAQVGLARAGVAEREEALLQTTVRAPIAGRVGQRAAEVGMRVDGQTPLFTVGQLDRMRVRVPITQEMVGRIREGQRAEIRFDGAAGAPLEARVSRISPFLEAGSYTAQAEIDVSNPAGRLLPGMFVTVDVLYGESEQATLVPTSALHERPDTGEEGVYVAPSSALNLAVGADGVSALSAPTGFEFRSVSVLAEGDQSLGVAGVAPGEWVVVVGQHLLSEEARGGPVSARVRALGWDRILALQAMQRQDLLRQFMEKQQRIAREREARAAES